MSVNTAIFLSVRDKSTRFPQKVRKVIQKQSVTEHLIDRLRLAKEPNTIIMTTSTHANDDWLVSIAEKKGVTAFRGDEVDKLKRYLDAATEYGIEFCVIVDGDDIFADGSFIDEIIRRYKSHGDDYIICDELPLGVTGFGIKVAALDYVVKTKKEHDTEVWGAYFTRNKRFKVHNIQVPLHFRRPEYRLTLDYPDDLRLFQIIYHRLSPEGGVIPLEQIVKFLDAHPEIASINKEAQQQYERNIAQPKKLVEIEMENWSNG